MKITLQKMSYVDNVWLVFAPNSKFIGYVVKSNENKNLLRYWHLPIDGSINMVLSSKEELEKYLESCCRAMFNVEYKFNWDGFDD